MEADAVSPQEFRLSCRNQIFTGQTSGICPGFAQYNLVILPRRFASAFKRFCESNPKSCPLLEVLDGDPFTRLVADRADIRSDFPAYQVYRYGVPCERTNDIQSLWEEASSSSTRGERRQQRQQQQEQQQQEQQQPRHEEEGGGGKEDEEEEGEEEVGLVGFLLGCSFSFEEALEKEDLSVRHCEQGVNVPMFKTNIACSPVPPHFEGNMVVSMRPYLPSQVQRVIQVTERFPRVHGGPVHVGPASAIGIADVSKPDYGDAVTMQEGEVGVYWACGVTPQAVLLGNRDIPLCVTHAPGHMLVGDVLNEELAGLPTPPVADSRSGSGSGSDEATVGDTLAVDASSPAGGGGDGSRRS